MTGRDDDESERAEEAWRSIVDNYGERAELDEPEPEPPAEPLLREQPPTAYEADGEDEEGYVPPEPPPLPHVPTPQLAGWAGVLGAPVLLLVCLLAGIALPGWASLLLVAAFVGGFLFLVLRMPREPRDPWDDGSRL